ncbi:hypothetical protein [Alkalicoccus daliensis]|uniref:Uncharacterized protein n=1 Tax=Alkalicoccus daliensis TaxID=745820 RepID=A0A1H0I113_9BACI|nr:hypothetical protein [Alkalicoccus daliensis]SDO25147.1 hypothetical protein SAMN04488053_109131 [Alkalicoccus daliensis]
MRQTGYWLWEFSKLVSVLFIMLFAYSMLNALLLELAGGVEQLEESGLFSVFFLLQTAGILFLVTVYYRNRLQKYSKIKISSQGPLSPKWTRRMISLGLAAIGASYVILIMIVWIG